MGAHRKDPVAVTFPEEGPVKSFPLLLLLAVPASALAAAQLADDNKSKKQERKICKNQSDTHSRIIRARICRTAAEWSVQREQAITNLPFDHSYKAQIGNGDGLLTRGPR